MSEYWVSHKKYFCKYCDIYIADDVPSRRQHESGLRHKGNRERFVRNLYKQGEKAKKDLVEEKREMARIDAAANAAFARDISSGHASAGSSSRSSKSDPPPTAKKPERPTSVYSNYSTAQSLGYTDPDEERLKAEEERRKSQGVAGDWQVVAPPPPPLASEKQEEDDKQGIVDISAMSKRPADVPTEDMDDGRTFKLRKRSLRTGLDDIWDPDDIPIKLKSRPKVEAPSPAPDGIKSEESAVTTGPSSTSDGMQATERSTTSVPKWKPMGWKRTMPSESTDGNETRSEFEQQDGQPRTEDLPLKQEPPSVASSAERQTEASDQAQPEVRANQTISLKVEVKEEEIPVPVGQEPVGSLFRKRKLPSGDRGRR